MYTFDFRIIPMLQIKQTYNSSYDQNPVYLLEEPINKIFMKTSSSHLCKF